jgi:hypothetical protein
MEARYQSRLNRYVTAMRNGKPDMVPIRPFVAEFTGVHAGYTCQELAHDYKKALAAARKCAADFDWDADDELANLHTTCLLRRTRCNSPSRTGGHD